MRALYRAGHQANTAELDPASLRQQLADLSATEAPCFYLTSGWSATRKLTHIASVNTICIRLGHESLDVTLAYLNGKDAKSEEPQEYANSSSLALSA
jgi:hypothetical protein